MIIGIGNSSVFPALSSAIAASVHHDDIGPAAGISVAGALAGAFAPRTAAETDLTPAPSPQRQEAST